MPRFSFWTLLNYYGEALRGQLHYVQVDSAEHEEDLHNALSMDEAMSMLMEAGFRKPISQLKIVDKSVIRQGLVDYYLMVKVKMHMDQFAEGLQQLKILDAMRAYPAVFQPLFVYTEMKISAGIYKRLIMIQCVIWFPIICVPEELKDLFVDQESCRLGLTSVIFWTNVKVHNVLLRPSLTFSPVEHLPISSCIHVSEVTRDLSL